MLPDHVIMIPKLSRLIDIWPLYGFKPVVKDTNSCFQSTVRYFEDIIQIL